MTSPTPCACGSLHVGDCPGGLSICLNPGYVLDTSIQLRDAAGTPINWPAGTSARLRFTWGTGTELIIDAAPVVDSYLYFTMTADETVLVPKGSAVYIDVNYDSGDPDMWRPWRKGRVGRCS